MTTAQFIAAVEAKPNFIKWAKFPAAVETIGEIEKHNGIAYITTPDGTNTYNVWFMVDTATGEATWQTLDTMTPEANTLNAVQKSLDDYLKATFPAYFVVRVDAINRWAEAEVFNVAGQDLSRQKVLVYKQGSNPITHKIII
jgi:hypothetical protein